jgi:electron transfer flavoprotein alpha subunit
MSGALILAEGREGRLERSTRELIALGRREFGTVAAVVTDSTLTHPAAGAGAGAVYAACAPAFAQYRTLPYTKLLAEAAGISKPDAILLPAAYRSGRDLGPRLAARLDAPIITEITALARDGDAIKASRPLYNEKALATFTTCAKPAVLTCAAGICEPLPEADEVLLQVTELNPALGTKDLESTVEVLAAGGGKDNLADAKAIVAVGRGVSPADYPALVDALAKELNASIGASRAVTDAGHLPHDRQIGQTGATVQPGLYIAIGISGAIQHIAGMKGSKYVIAINKDKDAPIFKTAHAGIVDDYKTAVPKLLEAIRAARAKA